MFKKFFSIDVRIRVLDVIIADKVSNEIAFVQKPLCFSFHRVRNDKPVAAIPRNSFVNEKGKQGVKIFGLYQLIFQLRVGRVFRRSESDVEGEVQQTTTNAVIIDVFKSRQIVARNVDFREIGYRPEFAEILS